MNAKPEKIELPEYVLLGIKESIEQANRRELISFDDVKKEMKAFLKKIRTNKN